MINNRIKILLLCYSLFFIVVSCNQKVELPRVIDFDNGELDTLRINKKVELKIKGRETRGNDVFKPKEKDRREIEGCIYFITPNDLDSLNILTPGIRNLYEKLNTLPIVSSQYKCDSIFMTTRKSYFDNLSCNYYYTPKDTGLIYGIINSKVTYYIENEENDSIRILQVGFLKRKSFYVTGD
ncbi:hypothetical protein [Poritiphilus flavus]|uniref:Lipoprotein n=1 Tax=Poritiphilus flavus TaxID=2697053 RepID=A0A6L9EE24_9FLAO|nr:hypothetical protein [Poritiphilus flavus]NAS12903.1 hypothetical protein [Poritiphilus flavus]